MKTGRQIFESEIFNKIDLSIKVDQVVVEESEYYILRFCNRKWVRIDQNIIYTSPDNITQSFGVLEINDDEGTIKISRNGNILVVKKGTVFTVKAPLFRSGTPRNLNEETKQKERDNQFQDLPIVWLRETISGRTLPKNSPMSTSFDFQWYCLDNIENLKETDNESRHNDVTYPMTQLDAEIMRVIDLKRGLLREEESQFREFNFFGTETKDGFETYILDANLSGIERRATVLFDRNLCNC